MSRLSCTTDAEQAASQSDLVIEAIVENLEVKQKLFAALDKAAPAYVKYEHLCGVAISFSSCFIFLDLFFFFISLDFSNHVAYFCLLVDHDIDYFWGAKSFEINQLRNAFQKVDGCFTETLFLCFFFTLLGVCLLHLSPSHTHARTHPPPPPPHMHTLFVFVYLSIWLLPISHTAHCFQWLKKF